VNLIADPGGRTLLGVAHLWIVIPSLVDQNR
jgi:hypothetical protein